MWATLEQASLRTCLGLLIDKFEKLKAESSAPFEVEEQEKVTWLEPELVCEVAYQCVTREMRLRMPRFKQLRDDKTATAMHT